MFSLSEANALKPINLQLSRKTKPKTSRPSQAGQNAFKKQTRKSKSLPELRQNKKGLTPFTKFQTQKPLNQP